MTTQCALRQCKVRSGSLSPVAVGRGRGTAAGWPPAPPSPVSSRPWVSGRGELRTTPTHTPPGGA